MALTPLTAVDVNSLHALAVLLRERSVSKAATKLGVTQSAMSHRLRRLREQLGDPLLVASGRRLVPTARSEALEPRLGALFDQLAELIQPTPPFDPVSSDRTFVLSGSDYGEFAVMPTALAKIRTAAPRVAVRFVPPRMDVVERLTSGEVDLALGPPMPQVAGLVQRAMAAEPFVVVVRADHPKVKRKPHPATYAAAEHLAVSPRGTPGTFVDTFLAKQGIARRIVLTVGHFSTAPFIVAESDLLWTAPRPLAVAASRYVALKMFPPPFELPPFSPHVTWHERQHLDPGHQWLREIIVGLRNEAAEHG